MDPRVLIERLKKLPKKAVIGAFAGIFVVVIGLTVATSHKATSGDAEKKTEKKQVEAKAEAVKDDDDDVTPTTEAQSDLERPSYLARIFSYVTSPVTNAAQSVGNKFEEIKIALETKDRLELENSHLRTKLESVQFECRSQHAQAVTEDLGKKLADQTGSKVGRALATLNYHVPSDLLPPQLYTLAVSYFKAHEYEKSAAIFSFLTSLEDTNTYRTPRNYVLNAVSWFQIDNYDVAASQLTEALKFSPTPENTPLLAQARLWMAMTAQRKGDHAESQKWIKDLLDHHPHSREAVWANSGADPENSKEVTRATASP